MSKTPIRRLTLHRETLRRLDAESLRHAAGGATETGTPPECIENTLVTNETTAGGATGQCETQSGASCDYCGASVLTCNN